MLDVDRIGCECIERGNADLSNSCKQYPNSMWIVYYLEYKYVYILRLYCMQKITLMYESEINLVYYFFYYILTTF